MFTWPLFRRHCAAGITGRWTDVDFNMPLGLDKFALGTKINVEIDIQFVAPRS